MNKELNEEILKKAYSMDPKDWGIGEWMNEPEGMKQPIEFEYKDHKCHLQRNFMGSWCGYVKVPLDNYWAQNENYENLDVHGGVTFSQEIDKEFWIGFDCAHSDDVSPFEDHKMKILDPVINQQIETLRNMLTYKPTYKTFEFAQTELKNMIDQMVLK